MKLVILDRDGTINVDSAAFIKSPDEWTPLPGALEAIARLNQAGWHTVIASNQSGLGRGLFDMAALNAIHAKMGKALAEVGGRIDAIFICPHTAEDGCDCRKPKPGLALQIIERFGVLAAETPMVGDALRDLVAGHAAGCPTHFVRTGKGEAGVPPDLPPGAWVHDDLAAFAEALLAREAAAGAMRTRAA